MQDVNDCEQYLFSVSDENRLKFCEFFNECVIDYSSITKELHYFRLKLNRTPDSFKELVDNKDNWIIYQKKNTRYHMNNCQYEESDFSNSKIDYNTYKQYFKEKKFTSTNPRKYPSYQTYGNEYNMKFVDIYGMNEVVVTPDKDLTGMSDSYIIDYLKNPEHWLILTDDYEKAQNNSNFKYDPVNVGKYNYCGYEEDEEENKIKFINSDGTIKKSSSLGHQNYDVHPYLAKYNNWGNVAELIYGNSKEQRDNNGEFSKVITVKNEKNNDLIHKNWSDYFNDK